MLSLIWFRKVSEKILLGFETVAIRCNLYLNKFHIILITKYIENQISFYFSLLGY